MLFFIKEINYHFQLKSRYNQSFFVPFSASFLTALLYAKLPHLFREPERNREQRHHAHFAWRRENVNKHAHLRQVAR